MMSLSRITAMLLAALVLVTAQSAAVARTMPDAAGQMELCTGTGPVMVYIDAEGNPTAPPHLCPDYALSLIVALELPALQLAAPGLWGAVNGLDHASGCAVQRGVTAKARGPPRLV